jgi:hypothetical protein
MFTSYSDDFSFEDIVCAEPIYSGKKRVASTLSETTCSCDSGAGPDYNTVPIIGGKTGSLASRNIRADLNCRAGVVRCLISGNDYFVFKVPNPQREGTLASGFAKKSWPEFFTTRRTFCFCATLVFVPHLPHTAH